MPSGASAFAFVLLAGCADLGLGMLTDGTSVSVGKPWKGHLVDGSRIPSSGDGFTTREVWIHRNARYGTDELVELLTGVAARMHQRFPDVRIVIGDMSTRGGAGGDQFHRSHQNGRDADTVFYMRDKDGKPFEPDAMHVFDKDGKAKDGSGLTIDIPRQWALVKELLTAPEANVQWLFMYQPIADKVIAYAKDHDEPEALVARAKLALKQPGDSARHDDHMHVRVYCTTRDLAYGCEDTGPQELRDDDRPPPTSGLPAALAVMGKHPPLD